MNAGICIYDLPKVERDAEIDRARTDLLKRLQLYRINHLLNELPATNAHPLERGATPSATVAGNLYPEMHA